MEKTTAEQEMNELAMALIYLSKWTEKIGF